MKWRQTCATPCERKEHTPETCRTSLVHVASGTVRIKTEHWVLVREHRWLELLEHYSHQDVRRMADALSQSQ
jgi:hypothetical protein